MRIKSIIPQEKSFAKYCRKLSSACSLIAINAFITPRTLAILFSVSGLGKILDKTGLYLVTWILNDLSVYLVPLFGCYFIFRDTIPKYHDAAFLENEFREYRQYELLIYFPALVFIGSIATIFTDFIAGILDSLFGTGEIPDAMASVAPSDSVQITIFMIFVCVIGPVCEEIIFREILLKAARTQGDWFAVIVTAVMFGLYHGNFDQLPYAFAVGIILAVSAIRSDSIIVPLILHIMNNAVVGLGSYLTLYKTGSDFDRTLDTLQNGINIFSTILFFTGTAAFGYFIFSKLSKLENKYCSSILPFKDKISIMFKSVDIWIAIILTAANFIF